VATIEFLGAAATVTGSKFLLDAGGRRVLVEEAKAAEQVTGIAYGERLALAPALSLTFTRAMTRHRSPTSSSGW
jgi:hypothetical protein